MGLFDIFSFSCLLFQHDRYPSVPYAVSAAFLFASCLVFLQMSETNDVALKDVITDDASRSKDITEKESLNSKYETSLDDAFA